LADTLYTRALARAAEIQGSTQALACILHVPENTLLRWMAGRAQMPLQAFLKTIELIAADERKQTPVPRADAATGKLRFKIGDLEANCERCDSHEFVQTDPSMPLRYIDELACAACGRRITHGDLIAQLAKDAVSHSKALTAARRRRQAEALRYGPKLRMLRGGRAELRPDAVPATEPGKETTG